MARTALLLALAMVASGFGGCLSASDALGDAKKELASVTSLLAGPALWDDPQNAPHPAFGFATLSSPSDSPSAPWFWKPIPAAPLPSPLRGMDLLARSPDEIRSGAGMGMFGSLAVVPGYGKPTGVLDISDPAHPKLLSSFMQQEGMGTHRGVVFIPYPDGRLVVVFSTGSGLDVWDITSPEEPSPLAPIKIRSHKVGVIPGTPIVVNAASGGGGAGTGMTEQTATGVSEMFDFSDPDQVVRLPDFKNGFSCHHVYFWNDVDAKKFRGVCAGSQYAQLWDTADPRAPKVVVSIPIPHGRAGTPSGSVPGAMPWAHYAGLSNDGKTFLVGDESGGGSVPPGCVAGYSTPQGAVGTPVGAMWFYDVSNEKDPKMLGWYSPLNDPRVKGPEVSCTAHHGRMVPVPGRDVIAMSWYGDGVILIDFTDVDFSKGALPRVIDQFVDTSDTWETWYNQGYLFTGDLKRGMDVLKLT